MYDFHYKYIKQKYLESALLFTYTDSLMYRIQTDSMYEDLFDFSEKQKESPFTMMKTMYSLKTKKEERKRAKGVKKNEV